MDVSLNYYFVYCYNVLKKKNPNILKYKNSLFQFPLVFTNFVQLKLIKIIIKQTKKQHKYNIPNLQI